MAGCEGGPFDGPSVHGGRGSAFATLGIEGSGRGLLCGGGGAGCAGGFAAAIEGRDGRGGFDRVGAGALDALASVFAGLIGITPPQAPH